MNIVLWIVAGLLALVFLIAGLPKVITPREKLVAKMAWVKDATEASVKTVGALEVLGAIGLILPGALRIAPVLVPVAAVGLALVMVGATTVHVRHRDGASEMAVTIVLALLSVLVAWGRFGIYKF